MTTIIDDYVKSNGEWAKAKKINGRTHQTRSGAKWFGINHRCSGIGYHLTHPSYSDVTNGFVNFNKFVEWHMAQIGYDKADWHLDKDLLVKGNRVYSEEACILLPRELNSMIVWKSNKHGLPSCISPHGEKFVVSCTFSGKSVYLGCHNTVEDAFSAYKKAKETFIKQQANRWREQIDPRAYEALMNYQVEITD